MIVKIGNIKPNPNNPRTIKDERFAKLVKSLQDFPEMLDKRPLICFTDSDGKFVALGGNQRLKAAKEAGMKELPVMLADDWTPEQQREFVIKDNGDWYGEWDWDMLQTDWGIDTLIEWGLEMPEGEPFEESNSISIPSDIQEEKELFDGFIMVLKVKSETFPLCKEAIENICIEYGIEINIS